MVDQVQRTPQLLVLFQQRQQLLQQVPPRRLGHMSFNLVNLFLQLQ